MNSQAPVPINPAMQQNLAPAGYGADPYRRHFDPYETQDFMDEGFDVLKILFFILQYRWIIAAFAITGIVCGIFFTLLQTPLYRATAKVEVLSAGARVFQDIEVLTETNDVRSYETAREKMLSRDLAKRVVFELNLTEDAKFLAPTPSFSLENVFNRIFGESKKQEITELSAEERELLAIRNVRDNTSVTLVRRSSILQVSFVHPDPIIASKISNQLTKSFIDQGVDRKSETSDLARQFIVEQVQITKERLQSSEKNLLLYAQEAGISTNGDDISLITANITELNKALSEAIQARLVADQYNQQVLSGDSATLPEVFKSDSIQSTKLKIAELSATYQEKLGTLKPGFPEMKRLSAQINELKKQVNVEIGAIAKSAQIKFNQAKENEEAIRQELAELEKEQSEYQEKNIQYTILRREVDSNRKQYESLITKLNEVGVGSKLETSNASIVDAAFPPERPFSPRLLLNLAGALLVFLGLAGAFIYIKELLNNTFTVPDQIENELKVPVLGVIPFIQDVEQQPENTQILEAYRTLRTSVQFTGTDTNTKTILVTSSEPSEGKTFTSYKLAEAFAALGRSVLLIDSDLRKPRMHKLLNMDNGIGLSNLLTNVVRGGDVLDIFRPTKVPNLSFLSAGTIPPNPSDLLVSQKMGLTLHYCSKKYDLVIVDAPPVMGLSDAPILSRLVDATVHVVSNNQVTRKSAKNAVMRLRSAGANIVGSVLTKFTVNNLDYNYAYRYMQYNYYTYEGDERVQQLENHGNSESTATSGSKTQSAATSNFFADLIKRFT